MRLRSVNYPSYEELHPGASQWSQIPGAIDPAGATIRGGYYRPEADGGQYVAQERDRQIPKPSGAAAPPMPLARPSFRLSGETGDTPITYSPAGAAGVFRPTFYPLGNAGSISPPAKSGPGNVASYTGGGGFAGGAIGVGGGDPDVGTHLAGFTSQLVNAPQDHVSTQGPAGVVAPVGSGGPGVFPGGGTGALTNSPSDHLGFNQTEHRKLGMAGNAPGGPRSELVNYEWFGLSGETPEAGSIPVTTVQGSGIVRPIATRPTRKPSNIGKAYWRPWDKRMRTPPSGGVKVVIQTGGPAYGPGGRNAGIQHAQTPIMIHDDAGNNRFPGYSGGAGAPAGMSQTGYRKNTWRLQPQPWDTMNVSDGR